MLINIPRATDDTYHVKGTWQRVLFHTSEPEYRPFYSAMICCPECGEYLNLVNHTIASDGQVSPSVGHPKNTGCPWHTNPRLIGWEQWPLPEIPPIFTCERCGTTAHGLGGWGTWNGGNGDICNKCVKEVRGS